MTPPIPSTVPEPWTQRRAAVVRNALGVGVATGAYGISFGAVSVAAGLSVPATCALSVLLFSGGSQFALVGVLGAGGSAVAGVTTALLLGVRNALYGLRLAPLLAARGVRRLVAAQLTIDESTAMALGQDEPRAARLAFWSTGLSVFLLWNLATLVGAIGATAFGDPQALGLDAAIPAAFVALLWPRLRGRQPWLVAGAAAVVALALSPVVPAGVPVLVAALTALVAVKGDPAESAPSGPADSGPAEDGALP
jgi:predicted branched-subunit amino acid permease